jgi:hypothetical protein
MYLVSILFYPCCTKNLATWIILDRWFIQFHHISTLIYIHFFLAMGRNFRPTYAICKSIFWHLLAIYGYIDLICLTTKFWLYWLILIDIDWYWLILIDIACYWLIVHHHCIIVCIIFRQTRSSRANFLSRAFSCRGDRGDRKNDSRGT